MTTTDEITAAAQASAERYRGPRMNVGTLADREYVAHVEGWAACREYLAAQTAATAQDALLAVLPEDVRQHWERSEDIRERLGDNGCACYLCRTIQGARGGTTETLPPLDLLGPNNNTERG